MSIATELETKLNNNQRTIFITDADDLLAAWQFKRKSSSKRSKNMSMVPTKYRCSAPAHDKSPLMPCHVSIKRKAGQTFTKVQPASEYSTIACHGHGRLSTIAVLDLDTLDSITFTKRNISPYVSPVLDTYTLSLVARDLGITGKAIPKVINGHQYIAFVQTSGLRTVFPRTIYSAKNSKIITMAIGALGIKNMVKTGGIITFCITVPLTVLEAFLRDHYSVYEVAGNLASDLIKIGIPALMGAIAGIGVVGVGTYAIASIGFTIVISVFTGALLSSLDKEYQLTENLIVALEDMHNKAKTEGQKAANAVGNGFWNVLRSGGLGAGGGFRQ